MARKYTEVPPAIFYVANEYVQYRDEEISSPQMKKRLDDKKIEYTKATINTAIKELSALGVFITKSDVSMKGLYPTKYHQINPEMPYSSFRELCKLMSRFNEQGLFIIDKIWLDFQLSYFVQQYLETHRVEILCYMYSGSFDTENVIIEVQSGDDVEKHSGRDYFSGSRNDHEFIAVRYSARAFLRGIISDWNPSKLSIERVRITYQLDLIRDLNEFEQIYYRFARAKPPKLPELGYHIGGVFGDYGSNRFQYISDEPPENCWDIIYSGIIMPGTTAIVKAYFKPGEEVNLKVPEKMTRITDVGIEAVKLDE